MKEIARTLLVVRAAAQGRLAPGAQHFRAGRLGEIDVRGMEIILGPPLRFTRDNIDQFDF
jgi:rhamnose transport system substrate-binding protein